MSKHYEERHNLQIKSKSQILIQEKKNKRLTRVFIIYIFNVPINCLTIGIIYKPTFDEKVHVMNDTEWSAVAVISIDPCLDSELLFM